MKIRSVAVHCERTGIPEIEMTEFDNFCTIKFGDSSNAIDFFMANPDDVVGFKDSFMEAFNKFEKEVV